MSECMTFSYDFVELCNVPPITDVSCEYKIVEKKETKALLRVLGDIRKITDGYRVMSFPLQDDITKDALVRSIINEQIDHKLKRLYRYYSRHFGLKFWTDDWGDGNDEFSSVYRKEKTIEINLSMICECVKSWEV